MPARNLSSVLDARMSADTVRVLRALGETAEARGSNALVVGGVVRDLLLGIPNLDLDVVVDEPAAGFAAQAAARLGGEVRAVTRFGTLVLVVPGAPKVDVATARSETYERPGALPTVARGALADDLLRRDFTVNSLAIVLNPGGFGTLIDHYGGLADLDRGVLRVLTDRSFEDDPTRTLRAVRLSARYGFALEERTEALLRRAVENGCLATVTGERIMNEIVLILEEPDPWPAVERLATWGVLRALDGAWAGAPSEAVFRATAAALRPGAPCATPDAEPWIAFFLELVEPVPAGERDRVLDRLAAPRRLRDAVRDAAGLGRLAAGPLGSETEMRRSEIRRLLAACAPESLVHACARSAGGPAAARVALHLSELRHVRTRLSGSDVEALGVPRGPAVGRILAALLDAKLDGLVVSRADEEALARALASEAES